MLYFKIECSFREIFVIFAVEKNNSFAVVLDLGT